MTHVSVAFNDATQVPYLALVADGSNFQVVNVSGEVPGSQATLAQMRSLFTGDGLDLFRTFDLYAASYGMTASPPVEVVGTLAVNAGAVAGELAASQGMDSAARRWMLQRVGNARTDLNLDSLTMVDANAFDPELGLDSAWLPEARQAFLDQAGWEPYTLTDTVESLAAALQVRIAQWGAAPHPENPIVLPPSEVVAVEGEGETIPPPPPPEAPAPPPPLAEQALEVEGP